MIRWWHEDRALRRFASHLLAEEIAALRPGDAPGIPAVPWGNATLLDENGLGVDSLDRLQLVARLSGTLDLRLTRREAAQLSKTTFGEWLSACRQGLRDDGVMSFRSSGSSGTPRTAHHSLPRLQEEAQFLAAIFAGRRRIVSAVPPHHIYGFLFTVLLPCALGCIEVEDVGDPVELAAILRPGDLLVAFPDFWHAIAARGLAAPADVCGTTSTAPCPADLAIHVIELGYSLTEFFGSSETAGLGWRNDPDAAFAWFPWWQTQDGEHALRRLPDGSTLSFDLADHLEECGQDRFRPAGRRDMQVQVGGINVDPAVVVTRLRLHPLVRDAAVRLMRPDEGTRLKAFIVPNRAMPPDAMAQADLRRWIDANLSPPERPRALRFGTTLPAGTLGKPHDWDA